MGILVEIGTVDQQALIKMELTILQDVYSSLNLPMPLKQIIIPNDFDMKINEIQNTNNYISQRKEVVAVAKCITKDDGVYIIFSKELFTKWHNNQTRLQMYLHELLHAVNKNRWPNLNKDSPTEYNYLLNMYILYDEYYANRKAVQITEKILPKLSFCYIKHNVKVLKGFIETLVDDNKSYNPIIREINNFRISRDKDTYLKNICPLFDDISKAMVQIYSYLDGSDKYGRYKSLMIESKFFNENSRALLDLFDKKYRDDSFELIEEKSYMESYMGNFGIKYEDARGGGYCHVKDIG